MGLPTYIQGANIMDWGIDWSMSLPALHVLGFLVLVDVVFGTGVAFAKGEVSSMASYLGWMKKLSMFVAVTVGYAIEIMYVNYRDIMPFSLPPNAPVAVLFASGFIWMEILSISEKLKRSGMKFPWVMQWILDRLKQAIDGPPDRGTINIPNVSISHAEIKKMDSDVLVNPTVAKVAARRAERAERSAIRVETKLDEIQQQQVANGETLSAIAEHDTERAAAERTEPIH